MIEMYVKFEEGHLKEWSSSLHGDVYTPAFLEDDAFYPDRLEGYELDTSRTLGDYRLRYNEELYRSRQRAKEKAAAQAVADEMYQRKAMATFLTSASDEEALSMKAVYEDYEVDRDYKAGERFIYNGDLYRVLQDHISQTDWIPGIAPSLYVNCANPAVEWPDFVQPTGAHDAYNAGDKVTFQEAHYMSLIDGNVWSPEDNPDGWELAE